MGIIHIFRVLKPINDIALLVILNRIIKKKKVSTKNSGEREVTVALDS